VLTKDCPRGLVAARRKRIGAWTAAVGFMVFAAGSVVSLVNRAMPIITAPVQRSGGGGVRPLNVHLAVPGAESQEMMGCITAEERLRQKH
jgi:hypothetical protein